MPQSLTISLVQLVRVCLNDPDLRAEILTALEEGPIGVRTPCAHVTEGDRVYQAILVNDRDKHPGDAGFIVEDGFGWVTARLSEIIQTDHEASTLSADQLAEKLAAAKSKG